MRSNRLGRGMTRAAIGRWARRGAVAFAGAGTIVAFAAQAAHAGTGSNHCEPVVDE
jgi:hypothetical protein